MSKKEVIPYGILITKICQRIGIVAIGRLRVSSVLRRGCVVSKIRTQLVKMAKLQL